MRKMGKKGGKAAGGKGGRKRMAALSPEERKELARKAAKARWAKAKEGRDYEVVKRAKKETSLTSSMIGVSDKAVLTLLKRIKTTSDPNEVRQLSEQLERVIFHKQYANA